MAAATDARTGKSLYQKVWEAHTVRRLPNGQTQLLIGLHLVHEVTSPQAFGMLRDFGLKVAYPHRNFATVDHIVPTDCRSEPFEDPLAQEMIEALRRSCKEFGIPLADLDSGWQGIVHVVGPELGLTQPGMTIACGDSHTATHGALGALAFGIGATQVRDVLATQTLALEPLKVRRIVVDGKLGPGVYAKDLILHIIRRLGVQGGAGYAYEYAGTVLDALDIEGRLTVCNMSIEGGARAGYVNPDRATFDYLKGRQYAPRGPEWDAAVARWKAVASDADARYDDVVNFQGDEIRPTVTWGISPGQAVSIDENTPRPEDFPAEQRALAKEALEYMQLEPAAPIKGLKVDVCFIGSCTNGRLSDLREAARHVKGRCVAPGVRALVVPGSEQVRRAAEEEGLDRIFTQAGFEWRLPGCSMCLAMNPDKLAGSQLCASTSNRNFRGRMGSPTGRTMLMSPVMVAAAALTGRISDAREVFGLK